MIPEATSVLLIRPSDGYILGATRRGTTDQWGLIGGKKDDGEMIEECARREFAEETGMRITGPLTYIFNRECEAGPDGKSFNVHVYMPLYRLDIDNLVEKFKTPHEIEPGITVGFIPYMEVLKGPFGKFNQELLDFVLGKFMSNMLL